MDADSGGDVDFGEFIVWWENDAQNARLSVRGVPLGRPLSLGRPLAPLAARRHRSWGLAADRSASRRPSLIPQLLHPSCARGHTNAAATA